jgi:uncharacterized protein YbjT (DUF2867 family)
MVLVTGATGTVGTELVRLLVEAGQRPRVLSRDAGKARSLGTRVEVAVGDLDRPDTIRPALEGVDRMFLLTKRTEQDVAVLAAARDAGVEALVKLSTQEAGWRPVEGHGHAHHEREDLIRASGLGWTFLRPTMFMTTPMLWAPTVEAQGVVAFPGGASRLAPIDPGDVSAVACRALTEPGHDGKAYELTGPELLSVEEMVGIRGKVLGRSLTYHDLPAEVWAGHLRTVGVPEYEVDGLIETFRLVRQGRFAFVTDDVPRVLGRPARTFAAWCADHQRAFGLKAPT